MIVIDKHGDRFSVFRNLDHQKRTILVMGKVSSVEPVVRLAIANCSNPELWHIMDSAAITQDDVLKYYELTKV